MNTRVYQNLSSLFLNYGTGALLVSIYDGTRWLIGAFFALSFIFTLLEVWSNRGEKVDPLAEKIDAFRYRGLYPPKGKGSDDDVKRLKAAGEKGLALRLYLELHAVPLKEARRAMKVL